MLSHVDTHMNTPQLIVERTGGAQLGNCYHASYFKVKSFNRELTQDQVSWLRNNGFLGYGQDFTWTRDNPEPADGYNKYFVVVAVDKVDSGD